MCLAVTSTANNTAAAQYTCSNGSGQAWQVVGQQAAGHKVTLAWKPSTSSGVNGYYVYRGTTAGGSLTKLSGKLSGTSYIDANVQTGKTYYYATTAANSANQESGYSNKVAASVP
jgi:fibronectin type 3 domain-containing protein